MISFFLFSIEGMRAKTKALPSGRNDYDMPLKQIFFLCRLVSRDEEKVSGAVLKLKEEQA